MRLYLNQGDNRSVRTWTCRNGAAVDSPIIDLTNASAVEIHAPGMPTPTMSCTYAANATGVVTRTFLTADMTTPGTYDMETQITFIDGTIVTVPDPGHDQIVVQAQLG